MKTYFTEATVLPESKIALDHLPFGEGQDVAVFMMAIKKETGDSAPVNLSGSVVSYVSPFAPAADDWEALS
jgi:hypothetical protein